MPEGLSQQVTNLLAFAGGSNVPSDAIFIAVMGVTGAGKSTFVSQCTGKPVDVGHGLLSCTTEISVFDFRLDGRTVYLIDTPGFDDSNFAERPDFVILQSISAYLSASYSRRVYIHGVVFLHRITENRVTGSARRNIELMKALCGPRFFPNVALATTHWNTTMESDANLKNRENILRTHDAFFGPLVAGGAKLFRQDDGASSARRIVRHLIKLNKNRRDSPVLAIQRELVDENRRLDDTTAGKVVMDAAARKYAAAKEEIAALKLAIKQSDKENGKALREMKEENEKMVKALQNTQGQMAIRAQEITRKEQELVIKRLNIAHEQSKVQLAAHERQLSRLEEEKRQLQRKASASESVNYKRRPSHENTYQKPPPTYQEAVQQKEVEVVEKQAEVAVAQQRTFEEDVAIAAIPAVLAAAAPALLACTVM